MPGMTKTKVIDGWVKGSFEIELSQFAASIWPENFIDIKYSTTIDKGDRIHYSAIVIWKLEGNVA